MAESQLIAFLNRFLWGPDMSGDRVLGVVLLVVLAVALWRVWRRDPPARWFRAEDHEIPEYEARQVLPFHGRHRRELERSRLERAVKLGDRRVS